MKNSEMRRIATVAAPVRSQVVEMLRAAITSGQFAPGQRLIEKDLCDLMGVSRPSVREALRQVESEGLIVTIANRGPTVSQLSEARYRQHLRGARCAGSIGSPAFCGDRQ